MNKLGLESPAITLLTNATLRAASKTRTTLGFTLFKTDPIIFYSQQLNSSDKSLFSIRIRRNKVYQSHYFNTSVTLNAPLDSTAKCNTTDWLEVRCVSRSEERRVGKD